MTAARTLSLDLALHPNALIALLLSNPGAQLTIHEFRAALEGVQVTRNLTRMVQRGNLTSAPGEDGLLRYGLGRIPARKHHLHTNHTGRTLPTDADLHPCPLIALMLANPDTAITMPDVRATLPDESRAQQRLSTYVAKGFARSATQPDGWRGYTLLRAPDHTRRNLTPQQRQQREQELRARNTKREKNRRAQVRGQERARQATAAERDIRAALREQARQEREQARRDAREQERRERTNRVIRADSATILALLDAAPDGLTEAQITTASTLTKGRITQAVRALRDAGQLRITRQQTADLYQATRLELPDVPAHLTPHAERIAEHLATRSADTASHMAQLLGMTRWDAECALSALRGLGRLRWTFVEHLAVFSLARQEVQNAAD